MKSIIRSVVFTLMIVMMSASEDQSLEVVELIKEAFQGYQIEEAKIPFSDLIEFMQIGYDESGLASRAIACREIESFKPITGVVIVDIIDDGFILRSASFPDIRKIKNGKNRRQVESIIKPVKEIKFNPHSGKRAVNTVSGATRYGAKALNYINYMTRRAALELEKQNKKLSNNL